jgi:hypothetical protein
MSRNNTNAKMLAWKIAGFVFALISFILEFKYPSAIKSDTVAIRGPLVFHILEY